MPDCMFYTLPTIPSLPNNNNTNIYTVPISHLQLNGTLHTLMNILSTYIITVSMYAVKIV